MRLHKPSPVRRDRRRIERLSRLFYEMTRGEASKGPGTPEDMAARAVMIDALHELGSHKTAEALRRHGRKTLWGTLLHEKIRRTIYGPSERKEYTPRKPAKYTWIASAGGQGLERFYVRLDKDDIVRDGGDRMYLFEIGMGYSSLYKLVFADDEEEALETAEEKWPHLFLDEVDQDEADDDDVFPHPFPHPTKRGVFVRRSYDVGINRAIALQQARILDKYGRTVLLKSGETVDYINR